MARNPPTVGDLPHNSDLWWLVDRRSEVQSLLLELHTFLKAHRDTLDDNELDRAIAGLVIGAAFSLWRAVALFDARRDTPIVLENAEDFLDRLIADNMINYEREPKTKRWAIGYYLDNAHCRLDSIISKIGPELEMFQAFRTLHATGIPQAKPKDTWQVLFDTLRSAFLLLQDVERLRARGIPSEPRAPTQPNEAAAVQARESRGRVRV
jgi:hypothetical protein